jgi:hypothetical protein
MVRSSVHAEVAAIIGSAGRFTKRLNFFRKPQRPNHELARESEVL